MENFFVQHITKTPGVCGGRACIAGHRIRVQDIVFLHEMRSMPPKEIIAEFPGITLADVHAALAYYFDNRQEIENEFRETEQWAEWAKLNAPSKIPAEALEGVGGRPVAKSLITGERRQVSPGLPKPSRRIEH